MNETNKETILSTPSIQQTTTQTTTQTTEQAATQDTEYTSRMKHSFSFFAPITFLYAAFYAFCMYKNGSGITFPFFMAGSLFYLCFCLSKLEISLKKGSGFYTVSMMLLAVSTFCTDDWRIIAFNKTGIFLLMMSLLLNQFFDTAKWDLGKYLGSICKLVFMSFGELGKPFSDGKLYYKENGAKKNKKVWYAVLGIVIAVPLLVLVLVLLSSADAVFREMTREVLEHIMPFNIMNVVFRVAFLFFASYGLLSYLCRRVIGEEVRDRRKGEPVLAITITGLLSLLYLLFSGVQIFGLFLGKMQLPEGYTYAMYAREGFFQLLAVSFLNLVIVLTGMSFFKESKVLKVILTIMSLCTFVMIASSAMRMIIYIRYYYMTFLRILVLWALALLFLLFVGIIVNIYKNTFPLFRYSMAVVTILYLLLSFSHPDYIIAKINLSNAPVGDMVTREVTQDSFFQSAEAYQDYYYLTLLSADAAPAILPYLQEQGFPVAEYFEDENFEYYAEKGQVGYRSVEGLGCRYLDNIRGRLEKMSLRSFNTSRYLALQYIIY